MNSNQEVMESFIAEAREKADLFLSEGLEIVDTAEPKLLIKEIFRGVHSLKGTASFLGDDDDRLNVLSQFCHKFETFLDMARNDKVELNEPTRELIADGLNALCDDIECLEKDEPLGTREDMIYRFEDTAMPLAEINNSNGILVIRLNKSILVKNEVDRFNRLLWEQVERAGSKVDIAIDFSDQHRLSSLGIGAVIGMISKVSSICMLRPSIFMRNVFQRFNFDKMGIILAENLDECHPKE